MLAIKRKLIIVRCNQDNKYLIKMKEKIKEKEKIVEKIKKRYKRESNGETERLLSMVSDLISSK